MTFSFSSFSKPFEIDSAMMRDDVPSIIPIIAIKVINEINPVNRVDFIYLFAMKISKGIERVFCENLS